MPGERLGGTRVFARQRVGQLHTLQPTGAVGLPLHMHTLQLLAQRLFQHIGQHHHAVFRTLAFAHHDGPAVKFNVLHAQAQAFDEAHAGAIQQPTQQAQGRLPNGLHLLLHVQRAQDRVHLLLRQHHRQAPVSTRAPHLLHPRQLVVQHLLIEEKQSRQSLTVGGRRHIPFGCQPGEERLHVCADQFSRVLQLVKAHKSPHPVHIGLLGADAVVHVADLLAQGLQQAQRRRLA